MYGGVPPTTPPHAPVAQGPGSLGAMDATSLAFFLIFCHWHMLPKCQAYLEQLSHVTFSLQCMLTGCHVPWVLAAGGCPHIHLWCAPCDNTWGMGWHANVGQVGIYLAYLAAGPPHKMPGICHDAPFDTIIPTTAVACDWEVEGCRPGFQEMAPAAMSTPRMGGLTPARRWL